MKTTTLITKERISFFALFLEGGAMRWYYSLDAKIEVGRDGRNPEQFGYNVQLDLTLPEHYQAAPKDLLHSFPDGVDLLQAFASLRRVSLL